MAFSQCVACTSFKIKKCILNSKEIRYIVTDIYGTLERQWSFVVLDNVFGRLWNKCQVC